MTACARPPKPSSEPDFDYLVMQFREIAHRFDTIAKLTNSIVTQTNAMNEQLDNLEGILASVAPEHFMERRKPVFLSAVRRRLQGLLGGDSS